MYQIQQQLLQNICLGRPEFKTHLDFISSQQKVTFELKLSLIVQVCRFYCAKSVCKGKYLSIFSLIIHFHIAFLFVSIIYNLIHHFDLQYHCQRVMLSGYLNTTRRGANVSITLFLVVACLLFSSNIKWIEGLSILGGNQGPYGAHIPSLDDLGQLVDHVEDELIGHDASEVPDIMVSYISITTLLSKI